MIINCNSKNFFRIVLAYYIFIQKFFKFNGFFYRKLII